MFFPTLSTRIGQAVARYAALLGTLGALELAVQAQPNTGESARRITNGGSHLQGRVSLAQVRFLGFPAYRLSDGRSEAVIVPAIGRVMRYGLVGGINLLWNAPSSRPATTGDWSNWGGDKSWPAPQNRWPLSVGREWPPHPSWDGRPHQVTALSATHLRMTSGVWPRLGCRVIRDFSFEPNGDFVISQTYQKLNGPPSEIALWAITQVATPDAIFLPANPQSPYKNGFHWLTKPKTPVDVMLVRPNLLRIRPSGGDANKIGVDAPLASIVTVKKGLAFIQKAARPPGNYPDGAQGNGFPLEIFNLGGTGAGHYMETEFLSPLRLFFTGTSWTHTVRWSLRSLHSKQLEAPELEAEVRALLQLP